MSGALPLETQIFILLYLCHCVQFVATYWNNEKKINRILTFQYSKANIK